MNTITGKTAIIGFRDDKLHPVISRLKKTDIESVPNNGTIRLQDKIMLIFKTWRLLTLIMLSLLFTQIVNAEQLETYTNGVGMKFVRVPAGSFVMGENPPLSEGKGDEHPAHKVTISKPFYIGIHEVTQNQWEKVMGSNPSRHKGKDNPVDSVTWNDAQEFIKRLNNIDKEASYRLPTEAEWEYAARAGANTRYFFGNDESKLPDYAWITENAAGITHPVGQKKPNAWGIFDTSGNVRE